MTPLPPDTADGDCAAVLRYFLAAADGAPMRERLTAALTSFATRRTKQQAFVMPDGRNVVVGPPPLRVGRELLRVVALRSPAPFSAALYALATLPEWVDPTAAGVAGLARMSVAELRALAGDGSEPSLDEVLQRLDRLAGVGS